MDSHKGVDSGNYYNNLLLVLYIFMILMDWMLLCFTTPTISSGCNGLPHKSHA